MVQESIRKFAFVAIDDFENELSRYDLDYAEVPKNLGFEMEFTTVESRLTSIFTSAKEKRIPTTLTLNFLPPDAYSKVNEFRLWVQQNMNSTTVFEYNDTTRVLQWEGKIQKLGQEELAEWGGLSCPVSFVPFTPKFLKSVNTISVNLSSVEGKSFPLTYPYSYARTLIQNNELNNTYFDEVPLRVIVYGRMQDPCVALGDAEGNIYSRVQIGGLTIEEGEHLVIDAIRSKILLWRNGKYSSAYDYLEKASTHDSFLFAKGNSISKVFMQLQAEDTGYLVAYYRHYVL